jgi:hypothetical protein
VELEVSPVPTEEERAAIVEAVRRVLGRAPGAKFDRWWLAGVQDAFGEVGEGSAPGGPAERAAGLEAPFTNRSSLG